MALRFLFHLGKMENVSIALWFCDRRMVCSAWNMLNVRLL